MTYNFKKKKSLFCIICLKGYVSQLLVRVKSTFISKNNFKNTLE